MTTMTTQRGSLKFSPAVIDLHLEVQALKYIIQDRQTGTIKKRGFYLWHTKPARSDHRTVYCRTGIEWTAVKSEYPLEIRGKITCSYCGRTGEVHDGVWRDT